MNKELWNEVVEKHGHSCSGVAIGFRIGEEVKKIFDEDEKIICVTSLHNCVVDGVSIVNGLSAEDGTIRFDDSVEGLIFYSVDEDEGWNFKFEKLEISEFADPVLWVLAANRDMLFKIEPCDVPVGKA